MPELVLAAYLGTAHTMSAPVSLVQPAAGTEITLASVDYRGESFTPPFYYGYRLSYFPKRQTLAIDRGDARGLFASHHGVFGIAWHSR